jgi:hypothetical protein
MNANTILISISMFQVLLTLPYLLIHHALFLVSPFLHNTAIKVNFAEARPGDVWPPPKKVMSGGGSGSGGGQAGGSGIKAMSAKPENCSKLFIGNVSYARQRGDRLPVPLYSLRCFSSPSKSFRMRLMMMRLQSSLALLIRR